MRKILSTLFSVYTLAMVDFVIAGDSLNDAVRGRAVALNIAFTFGFLVLGFSALMRLAGESYRDGKLDGSINAWETINRMLSVRDSKYAVEQRVAAQHVADLQARRG